MWAGSCLQGGLYTSSRCFGLVSWCFIFGGFSLICIVYVVSNPYKGLDRKMVGVRTNDAPTWVDFSPCGDVHL